MANAKVYQNPRHVSACLCCGLLRLGPRSAGVFSMDVMLHGKNGYIYRYYIHVCVFICTCVNMCMYIHIYANYM